VPGDHHHDLALQRSRSALRHMRYGDVQGKLRARWPGAGVCGSGYWPTMQQLSFHLWGNSECPGLRLNHGERVPNECVLSAAPVSLNVSPNAGAAPSPGSRMVPALVSIGEDEEARVVPSCGRARP
jgi:hypothetical protein